jgi:cyanamide hydratase
VYHYGLAIKKYRFPHWNFSDETYFLSCVLHDIGTTEENLHKTRLSFEFYGGFLALGVLQNAPSSDAVAPREQAESVAEAIIRHQDLCEVGTITAVGQLIQLATIFGTSCSCS